MSVNDDFEVDMTELTDKLPSVIMVNSTVKLILHKHSKLDKEYLCVYMRLFHITLSVE
jgi:hypothetical protein